MWKIALGFVVFAALAIWVISKGGNSLDMGGEKHGDVHAVEASAPAAASAPVVAASEPASAASN